MSILGRGLRAPQSRFQVIMTKTSIALGYEHPKAERSGRKKDGYMSMTPEGGFSGIAGTTGEGEYPRRMRVR